MSDLSEEEYEEMLAEEEFWYRVEIGEIEEYAAPDGGTGWAEVIYTNSETGQRFKFVNRKYVEVNEE